MLQEKISAISLNISHKGDMFCIIGRDKIVRIFNMKTGKIIRKIDESLKTAIEAQDEQSQYHKIMKIDRIDFDRRISVEKEIEKSMEHLYMMSVDFDENDSTIIIPTMFGIKLIDIKTGKVK